MPTGADEIYAWNAKATNINIKNGPLKLDGCLELVEIVHVMEAIQKI